MILLQQQLDLHYGTAVAIEYEVGVGHCKPLTTQAQLDEALSNMDTKSPEFRSLRLIVSAKGFKGSGGCTPRLFCGFSRDVCVAVSGSGLSASGTADDIPVSKLKRDPKMCVRPLTSGVCMA